MKNQINEYITRIVKSTPIQWVPDNHIHSWYIKGDGQGDYEETSRKATTQSVLDYIEDCKNQIILAKEYLKENRSRND